jgi:hypothetical protein
MFSSSPNLIGEPMEKAEFDKRFLALVNQSNVAITAPNIAYNLDIPIEEAQDHLLSLELNGVIVQKNDAQGNAVYMMPNRPAPNTVPAPLDSEAGGDDGTTNNRSQKKATGIQNPADLAPAPIYSGTKKSAPAKGKSINGLVFNIIVPGLGSLIAGKMLGLLIMGLMLLGLMFVFILPGFAKLVSIPTIAAAWIWSIVAGIQLLNDRESLHKA